MVFQAYSLFPNMTARENVEFGLRVRGADRAGRRRRAGELLDLVGLATQVGTPADIYRDPRAPFVAEFVGTMNRLPGTVESGEVVTVGDGQVRLRTGPPGEYGSGDAVIVLIRPESVTLEEADGKPLPDGAIGGRVIIHTFLGPVTRIGLDSDVGPLMADVASARALSLGPGKKVALRIDPAGIRLLPRG